MMSEKEAELIVVQRPAAIPVRPRLPRVSENAGLWFATVGLPCLVLLAVVNTTMKPNSTLIVFVTVPLVV